MIHQEKGGLNFATIKINIHVIVLEYDIIRSTHSVTSMKILHCMHWIDAFESWKTKTLSAQKNLMIHNLEVQT